MNRICIWHVRSELRWHLSKLTWYVMIQGTGVLIIMKDGWDNEQRTSFPLQRRHNERDGVSNHQPHDRLRNRLFRRRSKKTSKLRVTGLCNGNSPVACEFPAQRASNAENVSIWSRHHAVTPPRAVENTSRINKIFWKGYGAVASINHHSFPSHLETKGFYSENF